MTAPTPLSPAEIGLLRQVLPAARRKDWSRVFGDGNSEHLPDGVTVVAEWDQDGSLITLERHPGPYPLVLDICGMTRIDVITLRYAVDVLVAASVLPAELSSAHRSLRGRASDPAVVTAVATRLVGLLDHRVARSQAAGVITAVLDALEVAP